jgi:hypothetical protein
MFTKKINCHLVIHCIVICLQLIGCHLLSPKRARAILRVPPLILTPIPRRDSFHHDQNSTTNHTLNTALLSKVANISTSKFKDSLTMDPRAFDVRPMDDGGSSTLDRELLSSVEPDYTV